MRIRRFIATSAATTVLGLTVGLGLPTAAQASTTLQLCPTATGDTAPGSTQYDPNLVAYDPNVATSNLGDLVNCQNPFVPAMSNGSQPARNIIVQFGPIPASAFVGNNFKIRLSGAYGNGGFYFNVMTDKNTPQIGTQQSPLNPVGNPSFVTYQRTFHLPTTQAETLLVGTDTIEYTITASASQKVKLLAGDFAVQIVNVGGQGSVTEQVTSISIPYTAFGVTFDSNGGSGTQAAQSSGGAASLNANVLQRAGYTFAGWNTAANGSGTSYADAATFPFSADATLYAQWTQGSSASPASATSSSLATTGSPTTAPWLITGTALILAGTAAVFAASLRRRKK